VERAKVLKPLQTRTAGIEASLEVKERELEQMNQAIIEAGRGKKGQEIVEISKTMHRLKEDIDTLYRQLEALTAEQEQKKSDFEKELAALGD
jgi:nitrate/nitrite-specific signal transduction histidine kinase